MNKSIIIINFIIATIYNVESINETALLNKNVDEISEKIEESKPVSYSDEEYASEIVNQDDMRNISEFEETAIIQDDDFNKADKTILPNDEAEEIIAGSEIPITGKRSLDTQIEKSTFILSENELKNKNNEKVFEDPSEFLTRTGEKVGTVDQLGTDFRAEVNQKNFKTDDKSDDEEDGKEEYEDKTLNDELNPALNYHDQLNRDLRRKSKTNHENRILEMRARKYVESTDEETLRTVPESEINMPAIQKTIGSKGNSLPYNCIPQVQPDSILKQNQYIFTRPDIPTNLNTIARYKNIYIGNDPFLPIIPRKASPNPQMLGKTAEINEYKTIDDFNSNPHSNAYPYTPQTPHVNAERTISDPPVNTQECMSELISSRLGQLTAQSQNIGMKRKQYRELPYNNIRPFYARPLNIVPLTKVMLWRP